MSERWNIGPFELSEKIGEGGMGAVWRGRHRREGVPVAFKLLHGHHSTQPWFIESFRAEVRAVARLDHPGVVRVFDHGVIEERAAGCPFPLGSPWLAMELVPGGSLLMKCGRIRWEELQGVLSGLLEALAHAHSRGVVHRDLKPGNILLGPEGPVLVDFGLAHLTRGALDPAALGMVVGTAAYMAPEQFQGDLPAIGPWTDLYSLGTVAWMACHGAPPYGRGAGFEVLAQAHQREPLPRWAGRVDVPAAFVEWVGRLLEKDPARRFRHAAEAAAALRQIEDPEASPRPRLPASWQGQRAAGRPSMRLVGAGLGLYGLRQLPIFGREAEREQLWEAARMLDQGSTCAVVLQGAAGSGKSALARWLAESLAEAGVADVIELSHAETPGSSDGLAPALARHLRIAGLPPELALARLARLYTGLPEEELREAAALSGLEPGRFSSPGERHGALLRLLGRLGAERPLVLRMEDVHWGPDALAFASVALSRGAGPLLLLITSRDLLVDSAEGQLVDRLLRHPRARRVEVGPLPAGWRQRMLTELLRVEGDVVRALEERTAGNPLFMVQLVGDFIQRGLLVPGETGFRLRPGADPELPDSMHALWQRRLGEALRGSQEAEWHALELAAFLGHTVDIAEWTAACREVGAWASPLLVEALLGGGLAQSGSWGPAAGWSFIHAMLRDSLLRRAEEGGRALRWHAAVAHMLAERLPRDPTVALRLGRHRLALGELEAAIDPLLAGAWRCVVQSEYLQAEMALADREAALADLALSPGDRRPCEGWIMGARVARRQDRVEVARSRTARAKAAARGQGWPDLLCQALREEARLAAWEGERRGALKALEEARAQARLAGDPLALAWVERDLGLTTVEMGRSAPELLRAAAATFAARGEIFGRASCLLGLAEAEPQPSALAEAERALQQSAAVQEPAHAWVGLADVARLRGQWERAERGYRKALDRFAAIGAPGPDRARLHLATCAVALARPTEAAELLRAQRAELISDGRLGWLPGLDAALAWAHAAAGEPEACWRMLQSLRQGPGPADRLAAPALRQVARIAQGRQWREVARLAAHLEGLAAEAR